MSLRRTCLIASGLLVALPAFLTPVLGAGTLPADLAPAVVPKPHLLVWMDAEAVAKTPIQVKAEALRQEMGLTAGPMGQAFDGDWGEMAARYGIGKDDIRQVVGSISLEGVSFDNEPDFASLDAVVAVTMRKVITPMMVRRAVSESATPAPTVTEETVGGIPMLRLQFPEKQGNPVGEIAVAFAGGGKTLYFGVPESVKGALGRLAARTTGFPADLTTAAGQVPGKAQMYTLFVLPESVRAELRKRAQQPQQGNPMAAGAMAGFAEMKHLVFSMLYGERLDLALAGDFATEGAAGQMKALIDLTVLGIGRMMLMQSTGGQPSPFANSLRSELQGSTVAVRGEITDADLRGLLEMQRKAGGDAAPAPPPEMPLP